MISFTHSITLLYIFKYTFFHFNVNFLNLQVIQDFKARTKTWRKICETNTPMDVLKDLYQESHVDMTDFHFLILLRCVRPDTVINALQQYVLNNMGERFVNPPSFDLAG